MNNSLMRKSSDKVEASSHSGSATCHSRVCRGEGKKQDLDRSINQNKSIWSIFYVFWCRETKICDRPCNWKNGNCCWSAGYVILLLCFPITAFAFILSRFLLHFITSHGHREKTKPRRVRNLRVTQLKAQAQLKTNLYRRTTPETKIYFRSPIWFCSRICKIKIKSE
jgi:hypothetical protein